MSSFIDPQEALEAEQAVLGAVVIDNNAMDRVAGLLEARDFSQVRHEIIWKAYLHLYNRGEPLDNVTVMNMLHQYGRLEEVGGVSYITQLAAAVPTAANVTYYANIVRSRAVRRRGRDAGEKITQLSLDGEFENDEDYFSEVERVALGVRPGVSSNMKHIREARREFFDYLQRKDDFITTGFPAFDEWMGGIGRGWLYITAGRPSVGKTAITMQRIYNIARLHVGEVVMFSQEMTRDQLLARMISPLTRIPASRIRRKNLDEQDFESLHSAYDELEKLPIHIEDAKNVTIEEVRATARLIKRKHKRLAAIVVDYLTIMRIPQPKGMTRAQAIGEVTRAAKQTALELGCPFIMLAQMSREGAKSEEPQLHHLKESGDIEQDADVVEFLWHNPDDDRANTPYKVIRSTIAKGRDIGTNNFKYRFHGYIQRFEEHPDDDGARI